MNKKKRKKALAEFVGEDLFCCMHGSCYLSSSSMGSMIFCTNLAVSESG